MDPPPCGLPGGSAARAELRQLPPSANWYSASVIAWGGPSLAAYAAKNSIRLLNPQTRRMVGVLQGHSDRVTSVEFSPVPGAALATRFPP